MSIFDEARSRIASGASNTVNASQNNQSVFDQARSRISAGQAERTAARQREKHTMLLDKAAGGNKNGPGYSQVELPGVRDNTARKIDRLQNRMQSKPQDDTAERIRSLEQQAINYSNAGMTEQMLQVQKELDELKQSSNQGKLDALKAQRAEEKAAAWQAEQYKRMQDYVNLQAEKDFSTLAGQGVSADGWSKEELNKRISETDMEISKLIASGQFEEADNKKKELDSLYKMRSMGKYGEDTERDTYSYLLAKDAQTGGNEAQEYLKFMENTMNYRHGKEQAEKIQGIESDALRTLAIGAHGIASGVANAGAGYNQLLNGDEPIATSPMQYASQEIQEDLGKAGKLLYGASYSVGNMLPSILLSAATAGLGAPAAVASGIGAAAMGASSAGNVYSQAVKEGYAPEQAKTYAALVGASEATLQYLLGGISKLGGVTDDALLAKVSKLDNALARVAMTGAVKLGSEIGEEELQLYLEPLIKSVVFGEEYKKPGFDEVLETALVTALTTGTLEGKAILSAGKNTNAPQQTQINTPNEEMVAKMAQDLAGAKPSVQKQATVETPNIQANGTVSDMEAKPTEVKPAMGAADYGFAPYSNYQNTQSDFLPEGANPARPVDMPAVDPTGKPVRLGAKSIYGSALTSDNRAAQMELEYLQGVYGYDKKTNQAAVDKATATIAEEGYDRTYARVVDRLRDLKDLKQTLTEAILLYNDAIQNGNDADAAELALLMSMSGTEGGQLVQAFSMFRQLTPDGQLEGIRRTVKRINEKISSKRKSFAGIEIDEALVKKFREAPDQQARDAVMEEIYKDVGKKIPTTFGEAANQWRYTAMLFNPSTHIKNMSGNLSMMVMKMGKDAVGAGIETVANAATKGKTGRTKSILNVFSKQDQQLMQQAWADFENVKDDVKGVGKNKDNTMGKIGEYRDYWKLNNPETKVAKALDATLRAAETVPKLNNKAMDIEDQWFSQPDYALSLAGYMKANKLTEITPEARTYAINEARKATFRDANAVSDFAKKMGNTNSKLWNGIVNTIFPFKATPANVGVRAVEYSPVGLITTIGKAVKAKQNGTFKATDLIDDLSANFVGTALAAVGYLLAQDGFLRATGVGDEKEKEAQREDGYKDNSFELLGYSIPETMFTSASTPMFVGAALYEALATKALDNEAYTIDDVLQALAATTDPLVGQTMLDGLSDTLYSVRNAQGGVGEWLVSSAVNVAGNYLASYIPTLVSRISAAADGVGRETYIDKNSWVPKSIQKEAQDLMMKTPLRTKLPEKVDNYGRTQENWMSDADTKVGKALGAALNVVTPTFPSKIKTTDVETAMQELYRSGADTSDKKVFQTEAPKQITVDGEKVNLTAEEHEKLEKIRGENTVYYQSNLQDNDTFEKLPKEMQVYATDKMYDYVEQKSKMAMGVGYKPDTWVYDLQNASPEKVSEVIVQKAVESMAEDKRLYENKYAGIADMLGTRKINDTIALAVMSDTAVDGYMEYCKKENVSVADYAEVYAYMNKVKDLSKTLDYIDKMDLFKREKIALAQGIHYANPNIIRTDNPVSQEWLLKYGATDEIVEQFSESRKKLYDSYILDKVEMGDYLTIYNFKNTERKNADGEMKKPKQDEVIAEIDKLDISKAEKRNLFLSMDYSAKKIPYWWK